MMLNYLKIKFRTLLWQCGLYHKCPKCGAPLKFRGYAEYGDHCDCTNPACDFRGEDFVC